MKNFMDLLTKNKISTLLQFAFKARKLSFGESVIISMLSNKVHVMVLASDVSESQKKKYLDKAKYYDIKVVIFLTKEELGLLFNKNEVACVGASDKNMAKQILKLAEV